MPGLGSDFDIAWGIAPVNLATATNTGKRQFLGGLKEVGVLYIGGAGAAAEPPVLTLRQHTASSAGTSTDWAVVTEYWRKSEATLDNDESWSYQTQAAGANVTGQAQVEQMIYFSVKPTQLSAGNTYMSVDIADNFVGPMLGCVLYLLGGMDVRDLGQNMPNPLR